MWLSVIETLRKKDKLPVVAFVFSKKRIEEISTGLQSVDLLTERERSEVHLFFQHCVQRLKGGDRQLPQVQYLLLYCNFSCYFSNKQRLSHI